MKNTFLIILALFMGFAACKKDEDNEPQVNKDDLLCKIWQLDKEYINGEENQAMIDTDYEFMKGGTGIATVYIGEGLIFNIEWRWIDNQENLEMIFLGNRSPGSASPLLRRCSMPRIFHRPALLQMMALWLLLKRLSMILIPVTSKDLLI